MPKWLGVLERGAILTLPALAIVSVTAGLVIGRERPVLYARAYGGPTVGARVLSFRLELREHTAEGDGPWSGPARVEIDQTSGQKMQWSGRTDDEGLAEVRFEPAAPFQGPLRARVYAQSRDREELTAKRARPLTEATVAVTREAWARGGPGTAAWVSHREGDLTIAAAASRGAFAVPFEDALLVKVLISDRNAPGVPITVSAEGAEAHVREPLTDKDGFAHVRVRPLLHDAQVTVEARVRSGEMGKLVVALPVVPGAIHAEVEPYPDGFDILVRSPIPRERVYVTFVSDAERLAGAIVRLQPDDKGAAQGLIRSLPANIVEGHENGRAIWVVISSEPDSRSPGAVGWPLNGPYEGEPRPTFDVPDALWFDGKPEGFARETARTRRARTLGAIVAATLLLVTGSLVARRVASARRGVDRLDRAFADSEATTGGARSRHGPDWLIVAAVLCLLTAIVLVVVFARLK